MLSLNKFQGLHTFTNGCFGGRVSTYLSFFLFECVAFCWNTCHHQ